MTASTLQESSMPDAQTCLSLLERVAASTSLKRAARLRELLLYVGRRALIDGCSQVHESEIGSAVFERPADYDTSVDTIVRVNATELRKRIETYFNAEGLHEPVIMEIPRGSYIPVFRPRPIETQIDIGGPGEAGVHASETSNVIPETRHSSERHRWMTPAWIASGTTIVVLAVSCIVLWNRLESIQGSLYPWRDSPSVVAFWSGFLDGSKNTDIVISDSSFSLIQDLSKKSFSLNDYLSRNYTAQLHDQNPEITSAYNRIAYWSLASPGEFQLSKRLLGLDPLNRKFRMYFAREYMPDLIRRDNVVLIGSRIGNPWVELFEADTNFAFESDNGYRIVNRAPTAGEQKTYTWAGSIGYCVVAYLPNPDRNSTVLLIEGTNAEATQAAGDFLLSESQLSNFQKTLHVTKLPHFEVLLKTTWLKGAPLQETIEAYRVHPN